MYHYVRNVKKSRYPNLKALEFKNFKKQIKFFKKNFNIINLDQLIDILNSKKIPKKPSILMTFDDGFSDHYHYVFPYLIKKKLTGVFFPSVETIEKNIVSDTHKIHFILEKQNNNGQIINYIFYYLEKFFKISPYKIDFKKLNLENHVNDKETMIIKNLLQFYLKKKIRKKIIDLLFKKLVTSDEKAFSEKLYLKENQIKTMLNNNMNFGIHGYEHLWLGSLSKSNQNNDIKKSLNFFKKKFLTNKNLSFCYPYGSFNKDTLKIIKKLGINYGFSSEPGAITKKNINQLLTLPRFDTVDLGIF